MKTLSSRILSLIVALTVLLLPVSALAEDRNLYTLSIGNFVVDMGADGSLTLPVTLSIGGGADETGERGMLTASLSAGEQMAAALMASLENGEVRARLSGMEQGIRIPLEQLTALFADQIGDLQAQPYGDLEPEMQAKIERLVAAYMNLFETMEQTASDTSVADSLDFLEGKLTITDGGEAEISLFDETVTAQKASFATETMTMNEWLNLMREQGPEALKEYLDAYMDFINYVIAQDADEEMTMEEALNLASMAISGDVYATETGALIDLNITVTAEDETITMPFTISTVVRDGVQYVDCLMNMTVDGETAAFEFYIDSLEAEAESAFNLVFEMSMKDEGSDTYNEYFSFAVNGKDNAEGTSLAAKFSFNDGADAGEMGFEYTGAPMVSTAQADTWNGTLALFVNADDENISISMDTALTASNLPEGEIMPASDTDVNLLEADEDTMEALTADAQTALMQALGVLMQVPEIAALMGGAM